MPYAHIYVRVSTSDQDLSPAWQRQICQRYYETTLASRGFALNPVVYEDRESAFNTPWSEREAGRELFKTVQPGDVIVAAKQDRVWRSVRDRENSLFFLTSMSIEIAILDSNIDTTTAAGRFAAGIVALQSQWESDVRSERQKAARVIRRQRKTPMKAYPPPGWYFDKVTEQFLPDRKERRLLHNIYEWRRKRVRGIKPTCDWLTQEGIRRRNGMTYNSRWVIWAHRAYLRDWPLEGYISQRLPEDWERLPSVKGKKHIFIKHKPLTRAEIQQLLAETEDSH